MKKAAYLLARNFRVRKQEHRFQVLLSSLLKIFRGISSVPVHIIYAWFYQHAFGLFPQKSLTLVHRKSDSGFRVFTGKRKTIYEIHFSLYMLQVSWEKQLFQMFFKMSAFKMFLFTYILLLSLFWIFFICDIAIDLFWSEITGFFSVEQTSGLSECIIINFFFFFNFF